MRKRSFIVSLAVLIVFILCACGSNKSPEMPEGQRIYESKNGWKCEYNEKYFTPEENGDIVNFYYEDDSVVTLVQVSCLEGENADDYIRVIMSDPENTQTATAELGQTGLKGPSFTEETDFMVQTATATDYKNGIMVAYYYTEIADGAKPSERVNLLNQAAKTIFSSIQLVK